MKNKNITIIELVDILITLNDERKIKNILREFKNGLNK